MVSRHCTAPFSALRLPAVSVCGEYKPELLLSDHGITMVRFNKNATPAQMASAIADAGGQIVTDLTAINAVTAIVFGGNKS